MGVRISVSLVKCGQCGKRYSSPLTHECVITTGRRRVRTVVKPRVSYDCPQCKRPVTNPLTHVCSIRTDFRRRLAAEKKRSAAEKRAKAKAAAPQHDYHSCTDRDCQRRYGATAAREGVRQPGGEGLHEGYKQGYVAGFPDGVCCPRSRVRCGELCRLRPAAAGRRGLPAGALD